MAFFFLVLPYGISSGFVSITLPFFLTNASFSVAAAGAIVLGLLVLRAILNRGRETFGLD